MSGKTTTYPVVLLSLLVVAAANATPTVSNCNTDFAICAVSARSDAHIPVVPQVTQIAESSDSHLAAVAAEYLKPPASFTNSSVQPTGVKSLPPGPGALLMVLMGFLYVSLVKDRRLWLAALTGLLWTGQTGLRVLPQLAVHLGRRNSSEQQFAAQLAYPYYPGNSNRLRSDIDGTQYMGQLHHLAGIPKRRSALQVARLGGAGGVTLCRNSCAKGYDFAQRDVQPSPSAIIPKHYCLISPLKCLASRAEQFVCFSPAFIFDNLPRGPPRLA